MGLDLNSLSAALHSIKVSNGTYDLAIDSNGYLTISNSSFAVTATDLDIRDLTQTDEVTAYQGGTWDVGTVGTITNVVHVDDNSGSLTVDGTVAATQSGTWDIGTLGTITNVVHIDDNSGSLTVDGTVAATQSGTWDIGTLGTITNVVHIDDNGGSITVDGAVETTPSAYDTWQVAAKAITGTVSQLDATPLAGRINCIVQNLGSKDIYVGPSNAVTSADGLMIAKGFSQEIALDDNAEVWAICAGSETSSVRFAEYSA